MVVVGMFSGVIVTFTGTGRTIGLRPVKCPNAILGPDHAPDDGRHSVSLRRRSHRPAAPRKAVDLVRIYAYFLPYT